MKLYHKDVYMPKLNIKDKDVKLIGCYTLHAQDEATAEDIILPVSLNLAKVEIFELETTDNGIPVKVCVRMDYDNDYDLIVVLLLEPIKVKTVWLNHVNDNHSTLNRDNYQKPPK